MLHKPPPNVQNSYQMSQKALKTAFNLPVCHFFCNFADRVNIRGQNNNESKQDFIYFTGNNPICT